MGKREWGRRRRSVVVRQIGSCASKHLHDPNKFLEHKAGVSMSTRIPCHLNDRGVWTRIVSISTSQMRIMIKHDFFISIIVTHDLVEPSVFSDRTLKCFPVLTNLITRKSISPITSDSVLLSESSSPPNHSQHCTHLLQSSHGALHILLSHRRWQYHSSRLQRLRHQYKPP